MHDDPGFEVDAKTLRKHLHQIWIGRRDRNLADADPEASPDRGKLRDITINPQGERLAVQCRVVLRDRPDPRGFSIEADQVMAPQGIHTFGNASSIEISAVGVQADRDGANPLGQERLLLGSDHTDRDVGLPLKEIVERIGKRKFDDELRVTPAQFREDRGEVFYADDFARTDPNRAFDLSDPSFGQTEEGRRRGCQQFCERLQLKRSVGRRQTARRAKKERRANGRFERIDMTRDTGLG